MNDFSATHVLSEMMTSRVSFQDGFAKIQSWFDEQTDDHVRSLNSCCLRLARTLVAVDEGDKNVSWYDVAGHLRQVVLMFKRKVEVSETIKDHLQVLAHDFGLVISDYGEVDVIERYPPWFEGATALSSIYDLQARRHRASVVGDGTLFRMTGFESYASNEQKILIQASMNMSEGSTLLACMPTGGGKSLVAQYPAFLETEGGTVHGGVGRSGTTIIVVPTVALALDQQRAAQAYFKDALSPAHKPQAYYGGLAPEEKEIIYEGLKNGTIPLLFTSPESLLNGMLSKPLLDAAALGKIKRLVIDEAHIVVDWGNAFRTTFQLLSVLRRQLLNASRGMLKTILMSATLTDTATNILKELFSDNGKFMAIRADSLRTEPQYWVDHPKSESEREKRILEILPLLPRPIVVYTVQKDRAYYWTDLLLRKGFRSVEVFTSDTPDSERKEIILRWNADDLDMVVATSAFGMGVDKRDIRTIIHVGLPESINRFYQEVGRSGRDGFGAISLLSTILTIDQQISFNLVNKKILSVPKMVERWESLMTHGELIAGDVLWIDTGIRPHYLDGELTGKRSANWNEVVLLFLYRHGFIDILDVQNSDDMESKGRKILIRLRNIDVLKNKDRLEAELGSPRDQEWQNIKEEFDRIVRLAKDYGDVCFADRFVSIYPYASRGCGGCPHCRSKGQAYFPTASHVTVEWPWPTGPDASPEPLTVNDSLRVVLGENKDLLLYSPQYDGNLNTPTTLDLVTYLIESGIQYVIFANLPEGAWSNMLRRLSRIAWKPHFVLTAQELFAPYYRLAGPIATLYDPSDSAGSSIMFRWTRQYQANRRGNQVIHIAPKDLFITSEHRPIDHAVDGVIYNFEGLLSDDKDASEGWF